jgi:hypothetical protein
LQTSCTKTDPPGPKASGRQYPTYDLLSDLGSLTFIVNTYEKLIFYRVTDVRMGPGDKTVEVSGYTPLRTAFSVSFPNPDFPGEHPDPTRMISASKKGVVADVCGSALNTAGIKHNI